MSGTAKSFPVRMLLGMLLAPWWLLRWSLRSRFRLVVLTLLILGTFLGGSYEAYHYWASPGFCRTCHHMEPYYQSWKRSPHNDVACVQCHFKPGLEHEFKAKWVAMKQLASTLSGHYSSMPYAEVSDISCLRSGCHTREKLREPVVFSERKILFRHEPHLNDMRQGITLTCSSCHHLTVITNHFQVDTQTCFLCHFKVTEPEVAQDSLDDPGRCELCHGPPEDPRMAGEFEIIHADLKNRGMHCSQCHLDVKSGTGHVDQARCYSCHNKPERLVQFKDEVTMHLRHVNRRQLHCYQCHDFVGHKFETSLTRNQHKDCSSCHDLPHSPQAQLYAGKGARGLPIIRDSMHMVGLDCVACHKTQTAKAESFDMHGDGLLADTVSCASCHDERFSQITDVMEKNFVTMQKYIGRRLQAVEDVLPTPEERRRGRLIPPEAFRAMRDTEFNLDFLTKAHAVHNPKYSIALLRKADLDLALVEEIFDFPPAADRPLGFDGEDCAICHSRVLGVDRKYTHGPVAAGACSLCHEPHETQKTGPRTKAAKEDCFGCHEEIGKYFESPHHVHDPVAKDCGLCHETHASHNPRQLKGNPRATCGQCHEIGKEDASQAYHGAITTDEGCMNCHETHASKFPRLLKGEVRDLCLECHIEPQARPDGSVVKAIGKELEAVQDDKLLHGPIREGDCSTCHDPHGSQKTRLLRGQYPDKIYRAFTEGLYGLCFNCHEVRAFLDEKTETLTRFRNGDNNLHFLHVNKDEKGRTCRVCHETHNSHAPTRIRDKLKYASTEMEIDFERKRTGGSCSPGCHEPLAYDYVNPIVIPPRPSPEDQKKKVAWPPRRKKPGKQDK